MKITVGTDIFQKYRAAGYLYVDKTPLVREVLNGSEVTLLPRPRRFGKTLNLTMLHAFFDMTQNSRHLFEGLAITDDADAMTHLNAHPTIFISLKGMSCKTWAEASFEMVQCICDITDKQRSLMDLSRLVTGKRQRIEAALASSSPLSELGSYLRLLSEVLYTSTGKKVILLIDEYDAPIHAGLNHGYYEEVVTFFRVFLGEALKSNPYLERAVLTGILRIAKESIFSGLNNLSVHTILSKPFSTCFGFTEPEVEQLLNIAQSPHSMAEVRGWYNGYRFGDTTIYNPWSILSMLAAGDAPLEAYWLNTSGNELIRELIRTGEACTLAELEQLLSNQAVSKRVDTLVTLRERKPSSAWSLLLFSGYLTAQNYNPTTREAELVIPNHEVREFYEDTVSDWLGLKNQSAGLVDQLLQGNLDAFAQKLAETVVTTLSYHDTAEPYAEQIFHVFVVGMLAQLSKDYLVLSNRESGYGRADLQLIPKNPGQPGFLFEFKAAASDTPDALKAAANEALAQARARDYAASFRQAEVKTLYTMGLASHGKRLALASTCQTLPDGPPSEVRYHLDGSKPEQIAERNEKLTLAGKIQVLQELKGKMPLPKKTLMALDLDSLRALLGDLKS